MCLFADSLSPSIQVVYTGKVFNNGTWYGSCPSSSWFNSLTHPKRCCQIKTAETQRLLLQIHHCHPLLGLKHCPATSPSNSKQISPLCPPWNVTGLPWSHHHQHTPPLTFAYRWPFLWFASGINLKSIRKEFLSSSLSTFKDLSVNPLSHMSFPPGSVRGTFPCPCFHSKSFQGWKLRDRMLA